jgi:hypothetical protein
MTKKSHSQTEHFTIKGHWWLPETDHKVAGELCYTEEDVTLTLYGGLNDARIDSPFSATPVSTEFPIIHGESLDKVPVTVLHSYYTSWTPDIQTLAVRPGSFTAIRASRMHCGRLLEGIHLPSPDQPFEKCRVEIPYLEDWLGDSPFDSNMGDHIETIRLDYTRPKGHEFTIAAKNCVVRLIHSVRPPGLPLGNSPTIQHRTCIEIASNQPKSVDWFADQASEVVGMIAVFYGGNLLSRRLTLYKNSPTGGEAAFYYPRHGVKINPYESADFAIRYEQVKATFGEILGNWLGASEAVKRARRILLSSERRPSKFIELRFLPLVHAAEVLSNEGTHSTIVSKDTYKDVRQKLLESLPDGLPEELIISIKDSLSHANSCTLKRKLLGMLSELKNDTCKLFCVERELFIKGIVDTRNHFTHYSTKEGRTILQGVELHWAIQKMSLMLHLLLLLKTSVPENVLQSAIQSHTRLSQERRVWQKKSEEGSGLIGVELE